MREKPYDIRVACCDDGYYRIDIGINIHPTQMKNLRLFLTDQAPDRVIKETLKFLKKEVATAQNEDELYLKKGILSGMEDEEYYHKKTKK